jgi:hypothetical protein
MALRTAQVDKRKVSMPETQVFCPPNLSDAVEIRAARTWLRSRRKMLDARNTSITFLPLSDGEQLTLRNQLDSRPKQAPKPEPAQLEAAKEPVDLKGELFFDRSRIHKIFKILQVNDNGTLKEIVVEVRLRPGRKLAPGTYELSFIKKSYENEHSNEGCTLRIQVPKGCQDNATVIFVIHKACTQFQNLTGYGEAVHMDEIADEGKEKFIIVTLLTDRHLIPQGNHPGFFVSDDLVKKHQKNRGRAIYNEGDYMSGLVKLTSELTNATNDPQGWSWTNNLQSGFLT